MNQNRRKNPWGRPRHKYLGQVKKDTGKKPGFPHTTYASLFCSSIYSWIPLYLIVWHIHVHRIFLKDSIGYVALLSGTLLHILFYPFLWFSGSSSNIILHVYVHGSSFVFFDCIFIPTLSSVCCFKGFFLQWGMFLLCVFFCTNASYLSLCLPLWTLFHSIVNWKTPRILCASCASISIWPDFPLMHSIMSAVLQWISMYLNLLEYIFLCIFLWHKNSCQQLWWVFLCHMFVCQQFVSSQVCDVDVARWLYLILPFSSLCWIMPFFFVWGFNTLAGKFQWSAHGLYLMPVHFNLPFRQDFLPLNTYTTFSIYL
jgi:hypothetical protein